MKYTIHDVQQRSPEWYALRLGKLTGSAAGAMMAKIKSGEAAARRHLRTRLALERLTNRSQESGFVSAAMQWGIDHEQRAIAEYEARTGTILELVGFVDIDGMMAGCSPDSFIAGRKGLVSVKCPESATHLEFLRTKRLDPDYYWQNLHECWCTGAQFVDHVSFDPRFEERLQFLCMRFEPTPQELQAYDQSAREFLAEVSLEVKAIQEIAA